MSRLKKIYLVSNLPNGGAKQLYEENKLYLSKYYEIIEIIEPYKIQNRSFISYLARLYFYTDTWEKDVVKQIQKNDICICYHSWLTKSPKIMQYIKCPIIYICHEPPREFYDKDLISIQSIKEKIVNLFRLSIKESDILNVKMANIIIANSIFSKKIIKNIYDKDARVIYPGVKIKNSNNKQILASRKCIRILNVGSINKIKNQLFIAQFAQRLSEYSKVRLTLVGNGCDMNYLTKMRRLVEDTTNLSIDIRINVPSKQLQNIYRNTDIFAYAPINEPFGLVALEALSYGIPIIAYKKSGGFVEIVSNQNGIIIDNLDPDTWAKEAYFLYLNKEQRIKIANNNFQLAKKFSNKKMNTILHTIIKSI